jgi:hypothetical protein
MQYGIFISQDKYGNHILERVDPTLGLKLSKEDSRKRVRPTLCKTMVGRLMYLTATRPVTMHVVSLISRFMKSPRDSY